MDDAPEQGHLDFRGMRSTYLAWGTAPHSRDRREARPIVLLHGFAQSAGSWFEIAPLLAQHGPVYALDLAGHGGSHAPASPMPYRLTVQGETLLAFLRHVESVGGRRRSAPKPVVVGYSMGGRVALAAAQHDPQAFGGLVLESAGLGPANAAEREEAAQRDAASARHLREGGLRSFMDRWERLPLFDTQRALPAEVRARVRACRLANDAEALARTFEHAGQHTMPDRHKTLAALEDLSDTGVPVLYLAGALDHKYRALAEGLEVESPALTTRIVQRAGHNVHLEAPRAFAEALAEFLS